MMVIPAVDIKDGRCVRLVRGRADRASVYADPVEAAVNWCRQGARRLHIVDLDGAFCGEPCNLDVVARIKEATGAKVQYGGGVRGEASLARALEAGVDYVIMGSALFSGDGPPQFVRDYPGRIIGSLDILAGRVMIRGWTAASGLGVTGAVRLLQDLEIEDILLTDVSRDGTLQGPDLAFLQGVVENCPSLGVMVAGGIASVDDVRSIAEEVSGIAGVILGKALYTGRVTLEEAMRAVEGESDADEADNTLSRC